MLIEGTISGLLRELIKDIFLVWPPKGLDQMLEVLVLPDGNK
jgi:hypothetical protein